MVISGALSCERGAACRTRVHGGSDGVLSAGTEGRVGLRLKLVRVRSGAHCQGHAALGISYCGWRAVVAASAWARVSVGWKVPALLARGHLQAG